MEGPTAATFDHLLTFFFYLFDLQFWVFSSFFFNWFGLQWEKAAPADRYGLTNSVKNIEWWKLGDDAKQVWKIE